MKKSAVFCFVLLFASLTANVVLSLRSHDAKCSFPQAVEVIRTRVTELASQRDAADGELRAITAAVEGRDAEAIKASLASH